MRVLPIRFSSDLGASRRFYEALGLRTSDRSRPGGWVELTAADGMLALHDAEDGPGGRCELAFEADEALEAVVTRLTAAGFTPEAIVDENFGRSVGVLDPDGVRVQINEQDRSLYT